VSKAVFGGFDAIGLGKEVQPPGAFYTRSLPFVSSPTLPITLVLVYLVVVVLGRRAIRRPRTSDDGSSDPAWLTGLVQLHNLFLIILSSYMCLGAVYNAIKYKYKFWGNGYKPTETGMAWAVYVFYLSKFYEFLDTFIMLAKRKTSQITVLHVYHHASISLIWWVIIFCAPGGDAWYSTFLNSLVHVIMYSYYLLATLVGKDVRTRRKYLWWGRYLTQFQMFQFVTMMIQAAYTWKYSPYPTFLSKLLFFYMITLLSLFLNFYTRKHGSSSQKGRGKKTA
jgi:elongation of very long chain fatty acids protein 4